MKNVHPAHACNTCPTRAGFLGVVEFSGCGVIVVHEFGDKICDQDLEFCMPG